MKILINGKECICEKGEYLLQVAKRNGFEIPTLCHHGAIEDGAGSCRLCIVEVKERGRSSVVVSCVYPVTGEIEVETDSPRIRRERGMILSLMAGRAPDSPEIAALCEKYAAPAVKRFIKADGEKCMMCGTCVKVCHALSTGAIATVNRGITKEIATPYHDPSAVCIGCAACAYVCPTGAITVEEDSENRVIWGKTFRLVRCSSCGAVIGTQEQLAETAKRSGKEAVCLCDSCRRKQLTDVMSGIYGY